MIETTKIVDGNLQITRTQKIIRTRSELLQEVATITAKMQSMQKQWEDLKAAKKKIEKAIAKLPEPVVRE